MMPAIKLKQLILKTTNTIREECLEPSFQVCLEILLSTNMLEPIHPRTIGRN